MINLRSTVSPQNSLWHRVPPLWSVERNPAVAARHLPTLLSFLSLAGFVLSVPSLLFVVSPRAPTPPGTAPALDEAASTIAVAHGGVAADASPCSELGVRVLRYPDGNAVDAMIAAVLCQGLFSAFERGKHAEHDCVWAWRWRAHSCALGGARGAHSVYDTHEAAPARPPRKCRCMRGTLLLPSSECWRLQCWAGYAACMRRAA